jgi:hypothetical protein
MRRSRTRHYAAQSDQTLCGAVGPDTMRRSRTRHLHEVRGMTAKQRVDAERLHRKLRDLLITMNDEVVRSLSLKNSCVTLVQDISDNWARAMHKM